VTNLVLAVIATAVTAIAGAFTASAQAQTADPATFPTRPIRMVVP
jgi:tripartite-type tricarboxylate transporter receptor subunit TctC